MGRLKKYIISEINLQTFISEQKGEDETQRFLMAGCRKYGKYMREVIRKIKNEYDEISMQIGPFETVDQLVLADLNKNCDDSRKR